MVKNIKFLEEWCKKTAEEFQRVFGEVPLNPEVGKTSDLGMPIGV